MPELQEVAAWTMPTEFPRLHGICSLDVETRDILFDSHGPGWCFNSLSSQERGYIVGIGIGWDEGRGRAYWPIRHQPGGNFDADLVLRFVRHYAADPDVTWVFHNGMYDRGWCRTEGIEFLGKCHDTMTAGALLNEHRQHYALDDLLHVYFGKGKNQASLNDALMAEMLAQGSRKKKPDKGLIWKLSPEQVGGYGQDDAGDTLKLFTLMSKLMTEDDIWNVYNLEMKLQSVLLDLREQGIRVDEEGVELAKKQLIGMEHEAQKALDDVAGFHVNVNSGGDLGLLFDKYQLTYPRTPKTDKPSFTKDWLKVHPHPVAKAIMGVRRFFKTRRTFLDGYFTDLVINGRVHPEIKPLPRGEGGGAISGRMSGAKPNTMNLPNLERDYEMGKLVRSVVLPDEGCDWGSADYSQQEPRLCVHYAAVAGFRSARAAIEAYHNDPRTDFHTFVAQITGQPRPHAKILNLAQMYGQGGASLCHDLGLPTRWIKIHGRPQEIAGEEGQVIIDQYYERMPFVKDIADECKRRAKRRGYIQTIAGRKCRFYMEGNPETHGFSFTHKSLNALIQGSAADQLKMAMVEIHSEFGKRPFIKTPVHDELGMNDYKDGSIQRAVQIMIDVLPLRVPMIVDLATGRNWGEAK